MPGEPKTVLADVGPVELVEEWSARATQFVSDVGATRLGLYLLAGIGAMAAVSVLVAGRRDDSSDAGPGTDTGSAAPEPERVP